MAVVAVAAHVMHLDLGDNFGLNKLAAKYDHDVASLDQVGCHYCN